MDAWHLNEIDALFIQKKQDENKILYFLKLNTLLLVM